MNLVEATVDGSSRVVRRSAVAIGADAGLAGLPGALRDPGHPALRPGGHGRLAQRRPPRRSRSTAEVTEELGSEVNVIFPIDAPPVMTEDTIAAASDEGDDDTIPLIADTQERCRFCARVDARTSAEAGRPGAPVGRPQPVPLLRPGDRPGRRHARGGHRRGLRPRGSGGTTGAQSKASHRRTGASTPRSCPRRGHARDAAPAAHQLGALHHGRQPQVPGPGLVQPAGVEPAAVVGDPDRDAVAVA